MVEIKRKSMTSYAKRSVLLNDVVYDGEYFTMLFSEGQFPNAERWRALCDDVFHAEPQTRSSRHAEVARQFRVIKGGLVETPNKGDRAPSTYPHRSGEQSLVEPHQIIGTKIPRLVLLPPIHQSDRRETGYIVDALIDDITIGLCTLRNVSVIAPYSASRIGKKSADRNSFFQHHSVKYVLESRVAPERLFAQLIFVDNNEIIWADSFSLDNRALLEDRRLISGRIALSISDEIQHNESMHSTLDGNAAAYLHYLLGRRFLDKPSLPNVRRARKEARAALQSSSDFSAALSLMARTYHMEWLLTSRSDPELLKAAGSFASQAITARSDSSDGYRELGAARLFMGAFDESMEAMDLAERLAPHYADVIAEYAGALVCCSKPELALQKIERATDLNPLSPDPYLWTAATANYALGRFDVALEWIGRMADPTGADGLSAASWAMLGNGDKAAIHVRRVREARNRSNADNWLSAISPREQWHLDLCREGLMRAGL